MSKITDEVEVPVWISLIIIGLMLAMLYMIINSEAKRQQKESDEHLVNSFSRMSTSPEIQDAYNRLTNPQK